MPATEYYDRLGRRRLICSNCGHDWLPRTAKPRQCPKCKSETQLDKYDVVRVDWLALDERNATCDDCQTNLAAVKQGEDKLCVMCLRKRGRI